MDTDSIAINFETDDLITDSQKLEEKHDMLIQSGHDIWFTNFSKLVNHPELVDETKKIWYIQNRDNKNLLT